MGAWLGPSWGPLPAGGEALRQQPSHLLRVGPHCPPREVGPELPHRGGPGEAAYLGMGWDVGTTGTNLGQLAICSWTFTQEATCTLILASVTWGGEEGRGRAAGLGLWLPMPRPGSAAQVGPRGRVRETQTQDPEGCRSTPRSRRSRLHDGAMRGAVGLWSLGSCRRGRPTRGQGGCLFGKKYPL